VHVRASVTSTNSVLLEMARAGAAEGAIVAAEEQTAGRGRLGRAWASPRGLGLWFTVLLRPPASRAGGPAGPASLAVLAGIVVARALAATAGVRPALKWPNDVLLGERKCAGVLAQVEGGAVVSGIGINVAQREFPRDLETPATSLLLEGARVSREDLLVALVEAVDRATTLTAAEILSGFTAASSFAHGRRVRAESGGRAVEGVTSGLDPLGFLRVREDNGMETTILAGGVRPCC
jgi:BirA family biotin operon repressor/biotin-[acetyl-CoA-carboxylase] ligase